MAVATYHSVPSNTSAARNKSVFNAQNAKAVESSVPVNGPSDAGTKPRFMNTTLSSL